MNNSSWDTFRDNDIRRNSYFGKSTTRNKEGIDVRMSEPSKGTKMANSAISKMMQFYLISMYGRKNFCRPPLFLA